MIPGTFIVIEDPQQPKADEPVTMPAVVQDKPVEENDQQRLIRQFQEKWQQILAFFQGIADK